MTTIVFYKDTVHADTQVSEINKHGEIVNTTIESKLFVVGKDIIASAGVQSISNKLKAKLAHRIMLKYFNFTVINNVSGRGVKEMCTTIGIFKKDRHEIYSVVIASSLFKTFQVLKVVHNVCAKNSEDNYITFGSGGEFVSKYFDSADTPNAKDAIHYAASQDPYTNYVLESFKIGRVAEW